MLYISKGQENIISKVLIIMEVYDWGDIAIVCTEDQTGRRFITELGEQFLAFSFIDNSKNL
jgi:hypothetical protein